MLHRNLPNRLGWDQWALGVHLFDSLALDYKPCATIPEFFFNVGSGWRRKCLKVELGSYTGELVPGQHN